MTVHELQQEILRLKREKNICILAHAYQSQPVLEVADYTGDSYRRAKPTLTGSSCAVCASWPRPAKF